MQANRASKSYKNFIEVACVYADVFEGNINLVDILNTPYPIFYGVIERQIERRKKRKERMDQQRGVLRGTAYKAGDFR